MAKKNQVLDKLMALGLTEKQALIFLSIQKNGTASVLEIFRDTHIQRPTIYENAIVLEELGLIETVIKGSKKRFTATAPERILALIADKERIAKEIVEDLATMKQGKVPRAPVRLYAGKEGAKKLAQLILNSHGKKVYTFGNHELLYSLFTEEYLRRLWEARVVKHIEVDTLFPASDLPQLQKNKDYSEIGNIRSGRRVRILPDSITWNVMYTIVDDTVLFWSSADEDFFFQFTSPSYAQSLKSTFLTLWDISTPFKDTLK